MDRPYVVALRDGRALPAPARIAAECRFISALERALGDADSVAATLRAWAEARESQAHEIARETAAMAVRWPQAYQAAVTAGMRGLSGVSGIVFDVSLRRGA
jgi:hypothetical protein